MPNFRQKTPRVRTIYDSLASQQTYTRHYGAYPPGAVYLDDVGAVTFEWDQLLEKEMAPERNIVPITAPTGWNSSVRYTPSRVHPSFICPFLESVWPYDKQRNPLPDAARYEYNQWGIGGPTFRNLYSPLGLFKDYGASGRPATSKSDSDVVSPSDMTALGIPIAAR